MANIRLLHTADVHIGMKYTTFGKNGEIQRKQIKETFKKVVDAAISKKVQALIIAGDLPLF